MATRYVKFDPANEAAAYAYSDWLDQYLSTISTALADPSATPPAYWSLRYEETMGEGYEQGGLWRDTNYNLVVSYPFDGPFVFAGNTIPAPPEDAGMRELGVIVDSPDWQTFD
jgi:hypothetical protein